MSVSKFAQTISIVAIADNCVLSRVCNVLTTMDLLPVQFRSVIDTTENSANIEIDVSPISAAKLDLLTRKLAQMVLVESVSARLM